jgi:sugar phosphate isomerase/epimerase
MIEVNSMKLCFNAGPRPMEEYFSFAKENGFPWIEMSCSNPDNFLDKWTPARIAGVKKLRDKAGIRYGVHSCSFINSAETDATIRPAVQKHLLDYVEHTHQLEAEYVVLHFGYHFSKPWMDHIFDCLIKTYTPVVELAEKYKISIGIENMNKVHEDSEIVYLGVTVEEMARVFTAIPSKYFGLTLDIAHASLLPGGPESFIEAFPGRIISTHVSDNDLVLDRHLPVGNGKIDFKRVLTSLKKAGFKGTLNLEFPDAWAAAPLSKKRLEPILDELGILKEALTP